MKSSDTPNTTQPAMELPSLPEPDGYVNAVSPEGQDYDKPYFHESTLIAYGEACRASASYAAVGEKVLALFDVAVASELPRVSHIEYDSHEICKHFASEVRKRLLATPPSAQQEGGS